MKFVEVAAPKFDPEPTGFAAVENPVFDAPPEQIGAGETFAQNATNVFGAGPALVAALQYAVNGKDYAQVRDAYKARMGEAAEQNPKAAIAGKVTSIVPETILGGAAGKAIGAGARFAGIAEKVAPFMTKSPVLASAIEGALGGGAYGAASGAGEALSNDKDVLTGALEGAGPGALVGGVLGTAFGGISKLAKGAGAKADEALIKSVTGEGKAAGELLEAERADILGKLRSDPELRKLIAKPAAEAEKAIAGKAAKIASEIEPLTAQIDKVTGGMSLGKFSKAIDAEIAALTRTPLREAERKALDETRQSVLKAWAPEISDALGSAEAKESKLLRDNLLKQIDKIRVPSGNFAALQSEIAKDGGKGSEQVLSILKKAQDEHLTEAVAKSPEISAVVEQINSLGKESTLLNLIAGAAGKKTEKEAHGGIEKLIGLFTHHGPVGAGLALATGHPIPAAVLAAPAVAKKGTEFLAYVTREAAAGNPKAIRALKAAQAAKSVGTATAGKVGQAQSGTLAESGQ